MDPTSELNAVSRAVLEHVDRYGKRGTIAAAVVASLTIVLTGCVWGMWIAGTPEDHWPAALLTAAVITCLCSLMVASPIVDISAALGSALGEMERRAATDALTGLLRRDAFFEAAESVVGGETSVAMVDVDRFKDVNDLHGHAAGDAVLAAIARRLADDLPGAALGRLGGDEFAVAAAVPRETLGPTLDALVGAVDVPLGDSTGTVAVTCSIGVDGWTDGEPFERALERADRVLLARKRDRAADRGLVPHR